MGDRIATRQFSELRPRKGSDKNRNLETFLLLLKKLPSSGGTVTFWDPYLGILEVQILPYGRHVPVALNVKVATLGSGHWQEGSNLQACCNVTLKLLRTKQNLSYHMESGRGKFLQRNLLALYKIIAIKSHCPFILPIKSVFAPYSWTTAVAQYHQQSHD